MHGGSFQRGGGASDEAPVSGVSCAAQDPRLFDIVVRHVGSAGPRQAAAVAAGLGLPVEAVIAAIYRAPTILAAGLAPPLAERLAAMLGGLGLAVDLVPAGTPIDRGPLLDVAVEIVDAALADAVAAAIGEFIGVTAEVALELLLTPPGMILGSASAATVAALGARLPAGSATLTAIDPVASRYALFAASLPDAERDAIAAIAPDIGGRRDDGIVATGLTRGEADRLWRRLSPYEGVRLVPEAFLRFNLELVAADGDAAALEALAGIPADDLPLLLDLLPVVIEERVPQAQVHVRLCEFAAAGFTVTAHLATFATTTLEIVAAPPAALGLVGAAPGSRLPLRLPPAGAQRARVLRARLEAAGADVVQAAA
jgi:hypothetical protein